MGIIILWIFFTGLAYLDSTTPYRHLYTAEIVVFLYIHSEPLVAAINDLFLLLDNL